MKLLIVCSINSGRIAPFIQEQEMAIASHGVKTDYFLVKQKGILGYLNERKNLISKIKSFQPDIIHAHYGLSGLLANLQRSIPVVTTYHGSDINNSKVFPFSKICMMLSKYNIFVSQKNIDKSQQIRNFALIPCGIDVILFQPHNIVEVLKKLNIKNDKKLILFAGAFDNAVKNPNLAIEAVKQLKDVQLLELKGYSRQQVAMLMSVVDLCLLTSLSEGSPQFIKEAMACNCPIVSVDVGDVAQVIGNVEGCYLSAAKVDELVSKIEMALKFGKRTNGRERINDLELDQGTIVSKLILVYSQLLK